MRKGKCPPEPYFLPSEAPALRRPAYTRSRSFARMTRTTRTPNETETISPLGSTASIIPPNLRFKKVPISNPGLRWESCSFVIPWLWHPTTGPEAPSGPGPNWAYILPTRVKFYRRRPSGAIFFYRRFFYRLFYRLCYASASKWARG